MGGHYDDATRTILVKRPGAELRHEYVHALHAADQHALGQEHPVWLSEGLATLFEQPGFTPATQPTSSRMIPADTWRLARVQAAARHDTLIPLDKLLKLDRAAFTARATWPMASLARCCSTSTITSFSRSSTTPTRPVTPTTRPDPWPLPP